MISKLEKWVFYLFLFCLPFQTRIILKSWGSSFNEWNSAFLYGTDILLAILFIFWAIRITWELPTPLGNPVPKWGRPDLLLIIFLVIGGLSLVAADNLGLGFYRLIKILEFVGFYYYIRAQLRNGVPKLNKSLLIITVSGFFQAVIAIGQSLLQHSLGLKWLGESILRVNFNAVAVVSVEGEKFLRAYGTTPHPNILAAWLFLAIFAFYFWYLYDQTHLATPLLSKKQGCCFFLIYPVLLWGFFITFSRVVIGLWAAGILARFLIILVKRKKYNLEQIVKKRLCLLFITTAAVASAFCLAYWPQVHFRIFISGQEQAVSQRILYAKMAGDIASDKPWLGVGLGQFVGTLQSSFKNYPSYFYQPVHNIYLLILDEIGFVGATAFVAWLTVLAGEYYKRTRFKELYHISFFLVFVSILTIGLFDHFLWSLQQGQLIFWLTLGLVSSSDSFKNIVRLES